MPISEFADDCTAIALAERCLGHVMFSCQSAVWVFSRAGTARAYPDAFLYPRSLCNYPLRLSREIMSHKWGRLGVRGSSSLTASDLSVLRSQESPMFWDYFCRPRVHNWHAQELKELS
jgi:hypothetical protein